jgi:hypothetical protein
MTSIARELAVAAPTDLGERARVAVIEVCSAQWRR